MRVNGSVLGTVSPGITVVMLGSDLVLRMLPILLTVTASHLCPAVGVGQLPIWDLLLSCNLHKSLLFHWTSPVNDWCGPV